MTLDDDLTILRKASLFKSLDPEHLRHLAFGAERRTIRGGSVLYHEGGRADCAYIIANGQMKIIHNGQETGPYGEGVLFGETALIVATEWRNTAIAVDDVEVLRISNTLFRRILEAYPELAAELHHYMGERLGKFVAEVAPIAKKFT